MLGIRFWNFFLFRECDYSLEYGSSQFHSYGDGWYEPDFHYFHTGDGYSEELEESFDVNCIYETNKI